MANKPTYEELEQRVQELEREAIEHKRAEESLRESTRYLRTLLFVAPYPIVVFTLDGLVSYLNPAFTDVFGWKLSELRGKRIPYVPPGLEEDTRKNLERLFEEKSVLRYETKRLTKDGRVLDVLIRGAIYLDAKNEPAGELVILRDITREKKTALNNKAMLRISMALPKYPGLESLLDYITKEIKELLGTEGAVITLLDEDRQRILFLSAAYDDRATQERVKGMGIGMDLMDQFVVSKVVKSGEPAVINDASKIPKSYPLRDEIRGYETRNFIQVPLKSSDRIIGALSAVNRKGGSFEQTDIELLNTIAGTVALSIENARFSEELKNAYKEVSSLNRAKDKVIHHLSHELKTPVSVLSGSLDIFAKRLADIPEETWKRTMIRAERNLERIVEIENQVEDILSLSALFQNL